MSVIENVLSVTPETRGVEAELSVLLDRRASISHEVDVHRATGDLDNNDPYHRASESLARVERQILELQSRMADSAVPSVGDDGAVRIGSTVTVAFEHDPNDVDEFTLVGSGTHTDLPGGQTCSAGSPMGEALMGLRVGDTGTYVLPSGARCSVTVVAVNADAR